MALFAGGWDFGDGLNHLHSRSDAAEYTIAPALGGRAAMIKKIIVLDVDKKLRGGGVRVGGPRHGDSTDFVF